jgi:hypothetical protein
MEAHFDELLREPLRKSLASGSVVEACVSFDRFVLRKTALPLRPGDGGLPDLLRQKAVAVLGEGRGVENSLVDRQPNKPAKQEVELDPLD